MAYLAVTLPCPDVSYDHTPEALKNYYLTADKLNLYINWNSDIDNVVDYNHTFSDTDDDLEDAEASEQSDKSNNEDK